MKKLFYAAAFLLLYTTPVIAQDNVGIGTSSPDASSKLDINTSLDAATQKKGMLPPMVMLATTTDGGPFSGLTPAGPAYGLLVFNINPSISGIGGSGMGYYYNSGNKASPLWVKFTSNSDAWLLLGNSNIVTPAYPATYGTSAIGASENFLGTKDGNDVVIGTSNLERFRISSLGYAGLGITPFAGFRLRVEGNTNIGGYFHAGVANSTESFVTIARPNWEAINAFAYNDDAVQASTSNAAYYAVNAANTAATGTGIFGSGSNYGVHGYTPSGLTGTYGVRGSWSSSKYGYLGGRTLNNYYVGVYGTVDGPTDFSMLGWNTNGIGTAVIGGGNFVPTVYYLTAGSGGGFTGTNFGCVGFSTLTTGGTSRAGGYFQTNLGGSFVYVGAINTGNVARKIEGNGTVNTTVKDGKGNMVVLSCPEAPENLFLDYGHGKLINGKAHIILDPTFTKNIVVSTVHPLRAFVQLEGDCMGVYVSNKTSEGFDVTELQQGKSNVDFTWTVSANRADEILPDGTLSKYSEERFAPAMGIQPSQSAKMETTTVAPEIKWKNNPMEDKQKKEGVTPRY